MTTDAETTCPICGEGTLVDLTFDERGAGEESRQSPDSVEVQSYDCGHEVRGPALSTADPEQLDVERRSSEDTVERPGEGGAGR